MASPEVFLHICSWVQPVNQQLVSKGGIVHRVIIVCTEQLPLYQSGASGLLKQTTENFLLFLFTEIWSQIGANSQWERGESRGWKANSLLPFISATFYHSCH